VDAFGAEEKMEIKIDIRVSKFMFVVPVKGVINIDLPLKLITSKIVMNKILIFLSNANNRISLSGTISFDGDSYNI